MLLVDVGFGEQTSKFQQLGGDFNHQAAISKHVKMLPNDRHVLLWTRPANSVTSVSTASVSEGPGISLPPTELLLDNLGVAIKIKRSEGPIAQVLVPMFPLTDRATHFGIPVF